MGIIRKLIIKEWYKAFLGSVLVLILLITVANLVAGFLRGNVTAIEVLYNYLLELPEFIKRILPISCLTASLFSINKLKNRSELAAIFASGLSRKKFIETILLCSFFISCFQFINSSFVQPFMISKRDRLIQNSQAKFRNLKSKGLRSSTIGSGNIWYKSQNYYVSFSLYKKNEQKIYDANIYYFNNNYQLTNKIKAKYLSYDTESKLWVGEDVIFYKKLDGGTEFPESKTTKNAPIYISETPKDFDQIESDITVLNIFKLKKYIDKLKKTGINVNEYLVLYLDKYSSALICIIFALMATIGIFNPNRRNSSLGKNIGLVFIFTVLYWLVYSYSIELGKSSKINVYAACFLVPFIFASFISLFYLRNKKLR